MNKRFVKFVETILVEAGWFYGRSIKPLVSVWNIKLKSVNNMELFPIAEIILNEFGGIKVIKKEGHSMQSFEIDPTLALGEDDRFMNYSKLLNTKLYPLGEALGGYYFLAVAENGQVFWLMDDIYIIGNNFN